MNVFYVDGKYVTQDQAMIPVDDLAILRGIGVFDLLRTYNGKPLFLKEHVQRLENSAKKIKLDIPWSRDKICRVVIETLSRNQLQEANVRIIVTGGSSQDFMTPAGKPRLIVLVTPLPRLPQWWYEKGVKVITMKAHRHIPGAKSIDYLPAAMALQKAKQQDAIEVICLDSKNNALEGSTSNLFAICDGKLVTPGRNILTGITRKAVLKIAKHICPVEIRRLPKAEMLKAQEVFITGTSKGLVPVVQIDDTTIGSGRPGDLTRKIMAAVKAHTEHLIQNKKHI
ncbi:MAG: branched-chain amino acid aminotransferase [Desulfobacteraceae bacterium]|nr:branched-chain amino acid aminotransferase [Desulfobacteraceae bacterium]